MGIDIGARSANSSCIGRFTFIWPAAQAGPHSVGYRLGSGVIKPDVLRKRLARGARRTAKYARRDYTVKPYTFRKPHSFGPHPRKLPESGSRTSITSRGIVGLG